MSWLQHYFLPHHTNNHRAKFLHPSSLVALIVAVFGFQFLISVSSHHLPQILGYASQIPPSQIISLTNEKRQENGLPPLKLDPELTEAAAAKAADMFARNYWAHVSPIGTQPWYFITQAGYLYRYAGENLARDFSDPASVVNAWMASPSHRDNVLNSHYQDIGVAVVDGNLQGQDTTLVVQMFGTRLNTQPQVDSSGFVVHAAEAKITPIPPAPATLASPFTLTKSLSLLVLALILLILIADVVIVDRRQIVRWTSKSLAHLIFLGLLFVAALLIIRGQIL